MRTEFKRGDKVRTELERKGPLAPEAMTGGAMRRVCDLPASGRLVLPALCIKDNYAVAQVPLQAKDGRVLQRPYECRGKPTKYRGLVALVCSLGRTGAMEAGRRLDGAAEVMAENFKISLREAEEYGDWFHRHFAGRAYAIAELIDCVPWEETSQEDRRGSWFEYDGASYLWIFRRADKSYSPRLLDPRLQQPTMDKRDHTRSACVGCRAGRHFKAPGRPSSGVEGNYHNSFPSFEVEVEVTPWTS